MFRESKAAKCAADMSHGKNRIHYSRGFGAFSTRFY